MLRRGQGLTRPGLAALLDRSALRGRGDHEAGTETAAGDGAVFGSNRGDRSAAGARAGGRGVAGGS